MSLESCGIQADEDTVNKVMGAAPMQGASWEQAFAAAQHFGARVTFICPATLAQVKAYTDKGVAVMIAWNPEGRPWSHASVIKGVDDEGNVTVADPNIPDPDVLTRMMPKAEFYGKWHEKWDSYLVRRPAMAVEREISSEGRQIVASPKVAKEVKVDPPRNPYERERGTRNWGAGGHGTRDKDVTDGRSRKDKHKKDWSEKDAKVSRVARAFMATYKGNPDGKPIYPNTIDHGYGEPLSGGTDVMRRLQNQLLHEQGSDDQKRPESPRLASVVKVAEAYDCLQDYRAGGLYREGYKKRSKDNEDDNFRTAAATLKGIDLYVDATSAKDIQRKFRDTLMMGTPRGGFTIILDNPKAKSDDDQTVDIYFRPEGEGFQAHLAGHAFGDVKGILMDALRQAAIPVTRTAFVAGTPIGDFIGFMDENAVRFTTGPTGWWLPAHNMAVRLTRQNLVVVLKYQVLPNASAPTPAYSPGGGWKGPLLHLAPMWWKHPRFGGNYPPTADLAQRLVGLMAHEPTITNTVKDEMQWVNDMFDTTVPPGIVTRLSMGGVKNAIIRWAATKIRHVTVPL